MSDTITMTATEAKQTFGELMFHIEKQRSVIITKHDKPFAVVLSYEQYQELQNASICGRLGGVSTIDHNPIR